MNKLKSQILASIAFLLPFIMMQAQDLPSLPTAPEISKGVLPNGMEYFLVANTGSKGMADYSLVQMDDEGADRSRRALTDLPDFHGGKPYRFLASNGISYSPAGYVSSTGNASVMTFRDVPAYRQSAADSTLMLIFNIAATSRKPQAVVISGDINKDKIRERMSLLSMMVPAVEKKSSADDYSWNPKDSVSFMMTLNNTRDVASINVIFRAKRTGRALMNTAVPLVSAAYAHNLGYIVESRIRKSFRENDIPLAGIRYRYVDAAGSPGDEYYSFTVFTAMEKLDAATRQFASVLSRLDKYGATYKELSDAKDMSVIRKPDNREYTDKCIAAYLYGSNLAPESVVRSYTVSKDLPGQGELELFNGFASALLDSASNLTLRFDVPDRGLDSKGVLRSFNRAWGSAQKDSSSHSSRDISELSASKTRVKLRTESAEPISGGKIWTFSNGMKVIYKKTSSDGIFHYALMLRGGFTGVPGLKSGEGAFVGDMLPLTYIAGMNGQDFASALGAKGISMKSEVNLSDMRITGTAPKHGISLLMKALLAMSRERTPDNGAFEYYRSNQAIITDMDALSPRDVNSLMDSIIYPNNQYTLRKDPASLGSDLNLRAEEYFAEEFSKMNDGVLALFGDLDEETLKKELCRDLGDFPVQKKISQRPRVNAHYATGSKTFFADSAPGLVGGGEIGVNIALSAAVPFSLNSYMSFLVAEMAVKKQLALTLSEAGAYAEVSHKAEVFPNERLTLYINSRPCQQAGLPDGVQSGDPMKILTALRSLTASIGSLKVDPVDLKAFKESLLDQFQRERNDPDKLIESVLVRYSEGRDIITGYKAAIDAVSQESINRILSLLQEGAEVEYVII